MKLLLNIFSLLFLIINISPQGVDQAAKFNRLEKIYRSLEYNTTAFNDLKKIWVVTDPVYVREIFNRFIIKNGLKLNGVKPTLEELENKSKEIYRGNVFVELRKRYYDDEIEILRFFRESKLSTQDTTDYFFDAITDFVYINEVLGNELYRDLKKQFYALNDLTKTFYDNKVAYNYDIYLHMLQPELMFWSLTTSNKNKYLFSLIGRWGNDKVSIPGWYFPDYVAGLKFTYIDSFVNNRPNNAYVFEIGTGVPARQPALGYEYDEFGKRLYHTGPNFYFKLIGNPIRLYWKHLTDYEVSLEGFFTLSQMKASDFRINYLTKFYSVRNYFVFFIKKKEMANFTDFGSLGLGAGFAFNDANYYLLDPDLTKLSSLDAGGKGKLTTSFVIESGLDGTGGLLNHSVNLHYNYNFTEKSGYFGVKLFFMLSNTIGFDFRYFTSYRFTKSGLPFYRNDNYIVFSPVIRINY